MTKVVIENEPDEYYDIFSSSLFNGKLKKKPLNWLEDSDRRQNKKSTEKEETDE